MNFFKKITIIFYILSFGAAIADSHDKKEELLKQKRDFGVFFKEHDRRRETNFKEVYPELADFYEQTQTIKL